MPGVQLPNGGSAEQSLFSEKESRLRLQTIVRLRWLAVFGQLMAISIVYFGLGFALPFGSCLMFIALSAWLNVFLSIRYPARHRLSVGFATVTLAYDILQLAALLYFTGGIENPFMMLIVVPVTVSAATLPLRNTIVLGLLAMSAAVALSSNAYPLPWIPGEALAQPMLYRVGVLAAVLASMTFIALYAWRISKEGRLMSAALGATELVLAREQKLHALDGLAAAAAHELGTPLSTIVVAASELSRQLPKDSPFVEDVQLLKSQAQRCREILQKLTQYPEEQDPLIARLPVEEMIRDAAAPYARLGKNILISAAPSPEAAVDERLEPKAARQPGLIYGLGNIIENATHFAKSEVRVTAAWGAGLVVVTIIDDGPGFKPEVIDNLGEPYVTTRPAASRKRDGEASGLGLGFFIAKTLLERSGARLSLANRDAPDHGAVVRITWPRTSFTSDVGRPSSSDNRTLGRGQEILALREL